jgi:NitT/TauT family transport system substrate-binding protein
MDMKLKHLVLTILALCPIAVVAQSVVFAPQWSAQTQFAGYYMAKEKGFYKAAGLNVGIIHPAHSETTLAYLTEGRAQFVNMNLSQALYFRLKGIDLVNVMQTSQVNSLMLVAHKPIPNIADLQNCRLGIWNYLNASLVKTILKKYGLNVKLIRFNSGVNVFLSHAVDVCMVGSYNEYPQLAECGYNVNPAYVMRLSDWGYDMPEEGVYVLRSYYDKHKDVVRKFVEASKKGWTYAAGHEDEAVKTTMKYVKATHVATNEYHQRRMLKEVLRLQINPLAKKRTFRLSQKSFDSAINFIKPGSLKYSDFAK